MVLSWWDSSLTASASAPKLGKSRQTKRDKCPVTSGNYRLSDGRGLYYLRLLSSGISATSTFTRPYLSMTLVISLLAQGEQ
jgi:hypothetical protein